MITKLIDSLQSDMYLNVGPTIEIAKGKWQYPGRFRIFIRQLLRSILYKQKYKVKK